MNYIDVCMVSRYVNFFETPIRAGKKYLFVHDIFALCSQDGNRDRVREQYDKLDGIFVLSPWHRDFFADYHKVSKDKLIVFSHGLDMTRFDNSKPSYVEAVKEEVSMSTTIERPETEEDIKGALSRYKMMSPLCKNKRILDFGCGMGYGTSFLSNFGSVVGIDYDKNVVKKAGEKYPNIQFDSIVTSEKLKNIDIICSMECIEHLEKDDLNSLLRLFSSCVPEFVGSTPNGDMFPYRPKTKESRRGFHVWHYTHEELIALFKQFYDIVEIYGGAFDPNSHVAKYTSHLIYARKDNGRIF
jgi:2-polyprenyl-3-methyl-5-hydroxy-6-metoxy-1,4-benzoquinol methylase